MKSTLFIYEYTAMSLLYVKYFCLKVLWIQGMRGNTQNVASVIDKNRFDNMLKNDV